MAQKWPSYGHTWAQGPIVTNSLAKYQDFWMRPSFFDNYYLITYSLQFVAQYMLKY